MADQPEQDAPESEVEETTDSTEETTDPTVETADSAVETTDPAVEITDSAVETTDPAIETTDPTVELDEDEMGVAVDAMTGEVFADAGDADDGKTPSDGPQISPELLYDPYGEEELAIPREDFEALLLQHSDAFGDVREGQIVKANVLRVTDGAVILEFGFKSEGSVPKDEFKDADSLQPGDEVEVLLESLEDDDGIVVLSKKKADFLRVWEKIREAHEADEAVKGTLVRKIKGGVTVDLMGVDAFLPGSQIALRRVPNIEDLIGDTYKFRIIKLNKRRRNIVVSRRVILESEREKKKSTLVKELLVGQVREGIVKNITDFGAFIDLGGLDGLLHITDMSWGRVGHPSEVVEIGSSIDVKVLDVDWDRERISLGFKQLLPYPWTDIDKKYPIGARVVGKVVSITNYGAFIELEKGVEGLVHISEMSWTRNVRHPSKLVAIGDNIEAVVLKVDPNDEKISLGMKQIEEDPWLALPMKYPTGTTLDGVVRNLTSFGAFVEIEPGIDGLVHVSDMSWTKRVEHPLEIVQKGDELQVMVLDVDAENKRISLGLKQLLDDPWPQISERLAPDVEVEGTVVRLQDTGFVADLGDDIEGFVPGSHAAIDDPEEIDQFFEVGDTVPLKVIESDAANRRIVLEVLVTPDRKPPKAPDEDDEEAEEADSDGEGATTVEAAAATEVDGSDTQAADEDEANATQSADDAVEAPAEDLTPDESEAAPAEDLTPDESEAATESDSAEDESEKPSGDSSVDGEDDSEDSSQTKEADAGEEDE